MAAAVAEPRVAEAPSSLLLVVGGECGCPGLLAYVVEELERGQAGMGSRDGERRGEGWGGRARSGGWGRGLEGGAAGFGWRCGSGGDS